MTLNANNAPEGLDDFLADQDPQSAMASQGLVQGAKALLDSGPKTQDSVQPEASPIDLVATGIGGKVTSALMKDAGDILGNEIGSVGRNIAGPSRIPIYSAEEAGEEAAGPGAIQRLQSKTGSADINQPGLTQQQLNAAMQKANRPKAYAQGGNVNSLYAKVPQVPVSGLPVSAIEGQDALANRQPASEQPSGDSEPAGLSDFVSDDLKQEKYGSLGQQAIAGVEGAGQGLVGPLAPALERGLGVKPEDIRGRAEANPGTHFGSELAGLVAPAVLTGGTSLEAALLGGRASALNSVSKEGALELGGKLLNFTQHGVLNNTSKMIFGDTLASKIGTKAAQSALDYSILAGSDEASKLILNDPNQSAETAISNIGLSGLLGGAIGTVAPIWSASFGDKAGKLIEDFKGRINEHVTDPDPVNSITNELGDYHNKIKDLADGVYGPNGLKAQAISKSLPEMNENILNQAHDITGKLQEQIDKMHEAPNSYPPRLTAKLEGDLNQFQSELGKENISSADVFNATQDLKQSLQGYSKFDKIIKPIDEGYDFVRDSKSLANTLRTSLEDKDVWGDAATKQMNINKAFKEYLPTLQDFEKKFTTQLNGEAQVDPGKVSTYVNQLGNPNATIKQQALRNFLEASEKYKKIIGDTHMELGMESPVQNAPMNSTHASLDEQTVGGKLADIFMHHGLAQGGGRGLGAGVGGLLGELVAGHVGAAVGSVVGTHSLGPFFSSALPGIAKSVLSRETSAAGLKGASEFGVAVAKGENALQKASVNLFKKGTTILADNAYPSDKDIEKLDKSLKKIQINPESLMNQQSSVQHYLPDHAQALDQSKAQAVQYLNSIRPNLDKKAPLDSAPPPSSTQTSKYNNALKIAQQPLIILDKAKQGTLTNDDMQALGSMYPNLYNRIKEKVSSQLIEHRNSGEMVPYKTRIGLSMLLAQPLDSSMQPISIQSTQLQQQSQQQTSEPKGTKSSPALQKLGSMYQTKSQARDQRSQKQD